MSASSSTLSSWTKIFPHYWGGTTWELKLEGKFNPVGELIHEEKSRIEVLGIISDKKKQTINFLANNNNETAKEVLIQFVANEEIDCCHHFHLSAETSVEYECSSVRTPDKIILTIYNLIVFENYEKLTTISPTVFPDMCLAFESGEKIPCHKCVLASASEVFSKKLTNWTNVTTADTLENVEAKTSETKIILERMSDDVKMDLETVECFLLLIYYADYYDDENYHDEEERKYMELKHFNAFNKLTSTQKCQLFLLADKYLVSYVSSWLVDILTAREFDINLAELLQTTMLMADNVQKEKLRVQLSATIAKKPKQLMDDFFAFSKNLDEKKE